MKSDSTEKFDVKSFALGLRQDIEQNRIRLPTLPNLSLEALLIVNDCGSSMADIAKIVCKDTSMATRLVRYANSPLYGGTSTIITVKGAITRIGVDAVRNALLSLAMHDVFTTSYQPIQERMERLWAHSVSVAIRAVILSGYFKALDQGEAMLAGLIHDVGSIPVLIKAKDHPILLEKEKNLDKLVFHLHSSMGKFILSQWNFDPSLVEVAAVHDSLNRTKANQDVDYIDIVQVANILSYDGSEHPYTRIDQNRIPSFQRVGLDLIEEVREKIAAGAYDNELGAALH
ncbi:MAG: HDOD domain-containing protein [Gammaproteobacteria bacterium]|nr:HDOD domain-containing protein [Gammaproteobacteria bacterium]